MAVIIYDGECGACQAAIRFVLAHDRGQFEFARQDGATGRDLLARHGVGGEIGRTIVLIEDGRAYVRSEALLRIAARLRPTSAVARVARVVPRRWRDAAYDAFARRRHRVFGRPSRCLALGPEQRRRLLDE